MIRLPIAGFNLWGQSPSSQCLNTEGWVTRRSSHDLPPRSGFVRRASTILSCMVTPDNEWDCSVSTSSEEWHHYSENKKVGTPLSPLDYLR